MDTLISYAQNFEDVILWRALSHVEDGCYVDVGAQSPDTDSVSRLFYDHGWRGLHAEPMPQYADLLRARRPDETVLQVAVDVRPGVIRFYGVGDTGLSTTDPAIAEKHRAAGFGVEEILVPAVTLDEVLEQAPNGVVHWLKIDVEGAEQRVIDGWTGKGPKPWILVIESTRPLSAEHSHEQWEPAVLAHGYSFVYFDGLNRFYVDDSHPELKRAFGAGPNIFDDFSLSPHSQFCALVNINYHALEAERAKLQGQLEARDCESHAQRLEIQRLGSENAALIARTEEARHEARKWWSAHEELQAQTQARAGEVGGLRMEAESLQSHVKAAREEAHRWWLAHDGLSRQLDVVLKDLDDERKMIAADRERQRSELQALTERIEAGEREISQWRQAHDDMSAKLALAVDKLIGKEAEYARSLDAMLEMQRRSAIEHVAELARAGERSRVDFAELAAQVDAGKHEAHRWWLAHEVLRSQLDAIEGSRSWRWTRPMRAGAHRITGAVDSVKRFLRPIAARAIQAVFSNPQLHRLVKPIVARVPFIYSRLRGVAVREQLFDGHVSMSAALETPLVAIGGGERDHAVVYLDKRAARILAELKYERNEKAT